MKNKLIIYICFSLFFSPCLALIEDDFVEQTLDKNLQIKKQEKKIYIDEFAQNNTAKNYNIIKSGYIEDNFAIKNTNISKISKSKTEFNEVLPNISTKDKQVIKSRKTSLDSSQNIKIKIKSNFSTRKKVDEGDALDFEIAEDILINGKKYSKGTNVKARIETLSLNYSMGVPADVVVGNFYLDNILLNGEISKTGANRGLWLRPSVYIFSSFFGMGLLLIPIRGGHAKIKTNEIFELQI